MFERLIDRLTQYALLMRIDRPIGTFLLLWPTLWGLWLASAGQPDPWILTVFIVGVFVMRSAGCVINDFADRHFDSHVERTRTRPIAAGRVTATEALLLALVLGAMAFALVLTLTRLTIVLALVGAVLVAWYPFTKRFTHFPQFVLGAAFSWSIPMAFAAQVNSLPSILWWLVAANLFWVAAYDTMYAMVDRDDDIRIGVKSTAILFGRYDRVMCGVFQALSLILLIDLGVRQGLNAYYYAGVTAAAGFALYQQLLIRERARRRCFQAFLNNAWYGAAIFVGMALSYL